MVYGIIILFVGMAITAAIISIAAAGALSAIGLPCLAGLTQPAWQGIDWNSLNYNALARYVAAIIGALVILFALTVLIVFFIRKSLRTLAQRTEWPSLAHAD